MQRAIALISPSSSVIDNQCLSLISNADSASNVDLLIDVIRKHFILPPITAHCIISLMIKAFPFETIPFTVKLAPPPIEVIQLG